MNTPLPTGSAPSLDDSCRILCVDDDPISQCILMASLARPGWSIECVCDGRHAIDRFHDDPAGFDVLVTDHWMPQIDGIELVRRLRASGFSGATIVVSASLTAGDRAEYEALGAAAVLLKPIYKPRLLAVVERSLALLREHAVQP